MVLAIFRMFRRLMAAAVGEGGVVDLYGASVLEFVVKVAARPPTAKALFICVNASWAFRCASCKDAACRPINREVPGSPPTRGLACGPEAGAQCSKHNEKLKG